MTKNVGSADQVQTRGWYSSTCTDGLELFFLSPILQFRYSQGGLPLYTIPLFLQIWLSTSAIALFYYFAILQLNLSLLSFKNT